VRKVVDNFAKVQSAHKTYVEELKRVYFTAQDNGLKFDRHITEKYATNHPLRHFLYQLSGHADRLLNSAGVSDFTQVLAGYNSETLDAYTKNEITNLRAAIGEDRRTVIRLRGETTVGETDAEQLLRELNKKLQEKKLARETEAITINQIKPYEYAFTTPKGKGDRRKTDVSKALGLKVSKRKAGVDAKPRRSKKTKTADKNLDDKGKAASPEPSDIEDLVSQDSSEREADKRLDEVRRVLNE
jgi:hypothetical protein